MTEPQTIRELVNELKKLDERTVLAKHRLSTYRGRQYRDDRQYFTKYMNYLLTGLKFYLEMFNVLPDDDPRWNAQPDDILLAAYNMAEAMLTTGLINARAFNMDLGYVDLR
jgi:hypothetical protein